MRSMPLVVLLAACAADPETKTVTNTVTNTATVTNTVTNTNTNTNTVTNTNTITNPPDGYPTVEAGVDQEVLGATVVQLDATASDVEGAVTLQWSQRSGPTVTLSDSTANNPTFIAPASAVFQTVSLQLTATDSEGQSTTDVVLIGVLPLSDSSPTAQAGEDQSAPEGTMVTLAGVASDAEGEVTTLWTQRSGPAVSLSNDSSLNATFIAPTVTTVESLLFELTSTDSLGQVATDSLWITITPINAAPTLTAPDVSGLVNEEIVLTANAQDADGTIESVIWTQLVGEEVAILDSTNTSLTFIAPLSPQELIFEVLTTDNEGASERVLVTIVVEPDPLTNAPPIVNAGTTMVVTEGELTTLSGSAEDPDSATLTPSWSQVSGPSVSLSDNSSWSPTFTAPSVSCSDVVIFELTVTDELGAAATDSVSVVVNAISSANLWNGDLLDFELDDGGLTTDGVFEVGAPSTGPETAFSGSRVWATVLDGDYPDSSDVSLCLPPLNIASFSQPVLTFQGWLALGKDDILSVEILDEAIGWTPVETVRPTTSAVIGWSELGVLKQYSAAAVSLPPLPSPLHLRVRLQSGTFYTDSGLYLDNLQVFDESEDADLDGLIGVIGEFDSHGTDPLNPDVDGDGSLDGAEVVFGSSPHNPADHPDAELLPLGALYDFELSDGGVVGQGHWQRGTPSNGPGFAASGNTVWATNLTGSYESNSTAYLFFPPVDLSLATRPTLAFRAWADIAGGESLALEVFDSSLQQWQRVLPVNGFSQQTDDLGLIGVTFQSAVSFYDPLLFSLEAYVGEDRLQTRLAFNTDQFYNAQGIYIDDLTLQEEASDLDNDGILGMRDELELYGTDPFVADSDRDLVDDGDELIAGTQLLNPADYPGSNAIYPGDLIDFETDNGGLVTYYDVWQWGAPTNSQHAYSGNRGWATSLAADYTSDLDEVLYLPPVHLQSATEPVFVMRLSNVVANGDYLSVEIYEPSVGWIDAAPSPSYDLDFGYGLVSGVADDFSTVGVNLSSEVGQTAYLRLRFRSDQFYHDKGLVIDDLRVIENNSDIDFDGLNALDELTLYGTNPDESDSDHDGVNDGAEVSAGTDPTDPTSN